MIRSFAQAALAQQLKEATTRQTQQQAGRRQTEARHDRVRSEARRYETRTSPPPRQATEKRASAEQVSRDEARRPQREDNDLFSTLIEDRDDVMSPLLAFGEQGSEQQGFGQLDETATAGAPPAMLLWQEIEPVLGGALEDLPPGEMMLTLMLPKLGNINAQMALLPGGGWDIALHLQPAAWQALLPHQERCRLSLRQRINSRVRLRFERRAPDEREQEA